MYRAILGYSATAIAATVLAMPLCASTSSATTPEPRGDVQSVCTPGKQKRTQRAVGQILTHDQTVHPVSPTLFQEPPALPGVLAAHTKKSGYVNTYAEGFAVNSLADVGSVTKSFTAALIMQLDQEKKLSIKDTIFRWRKQINWKGSKSVLKKITLKQVLDHTSGIPELLEAPQVEPNANNPAFNPTPRQLVGWASQQPMSFKPGTSWSYSNTDYEILGLVIEAVTGRSYNNQLKTRLIRPLGLSKTSLGTHPLRTIQGYYLTVVDPSIVPSQLQWTPLAASANSQVRWSWAAGGIQSTSCDLTKWIDALLGTNKVLDSKHRRMMQTVSRQSVSAIPNYGVPGWTGYGLGLMRVTVSGKTGWGHLGNIPGFSSGAIRVSARKISTAVVLPTGAGNAIDAMTRVVDSTR